MKDIRQTILYLLKAVNIPLNLWLIPKWGIAGAALASSVAYIIATIVVIIAFAKISGKSWTDILLIKKQDFQDYKQFIFEIRRKNLDNVFNIR